MLSTLSFLLMISADRPVEPVHIKTPEMEIEMTPRTPNQMGSFYEARGFPKPMLDILKRQCFITIGIRNTSDERIWLDLSRWSFSADGKPLERVHRDTWKQRWRDMEIPMSKQSTFRWTLIPETLDYLPGEREGGNVTLPFTPGYIRVEASFQTGDDKAGKIIEISSDKLFCAEDPAQ